MNKSNKRIEYFEIALNEIYTLINNLISSEGNNNVDPNFTPIMGTLKALQEDITNILSSRNPVSGGSKVRGGGRRRRHRGKYSTRKIKKGMKKRIIMKGGFYIGNNNNNKPKTYHRRQKIKKVLHLVVEINIDIQLRQVLDQEKEHHPVIKYEVAQNIPCILGMRIQ